MPKHFKAVSLTSIKKTNTKYVPHIQCATLSPNSGEWSSSECSVNLITQSTHMWVVLSGRCAASTPLFAGTCCNAAGVKGMLTFVCVYFFITCIKDHLSARAQLLLSSLWAGVSPPNRGLWDGSYGWCASAWPLWQQQQSAAESRARSGWVNSTNMMQLAAPCDVLPIPWWLGRKAHIVCFGWV